MSQKYHIARNGTGPKPVVRIQLDHDGECSVNSVAITPDGRRAVYGGEDRTVRVWDLERDRLVISFEGHPCRSPEEPTNYIYNMAVTPDGRYAVSGGEERMVRVWDVERGQCIAALEGHSAGISAVAISADGRRVVSGGWDKTVRAWDVREGRCLATLEGHVDVVDCLAITADGQRAFSGGWDDARIWDLERGVCVSVFHDDCMHDIAITPDGRRAVSRGCGAKVRIWDLERAECVHVIRASSAGGVALSGDGRIAVITPGMHITVWDAERKRFLARYEPSLEVVSDVAIGGDGRIFAWDWNGLLFIWPPVKVN